MRISVGSEVRLIQATDMVLVPGFDGSRVGDDPTPERQVVDWLASLRVLKSVPFEYLVADHGLLTAESIRFFHLDRNWTDLLVEGALAAASFGTRDRSLLETNYGAIRDAVDSAERSQWLEVPYDGDAPNPSGFLLRSRAVSGWPGLEALGFRNDKRLSLLRMERLAPAVLLVIFDDVPDMVRIREPRQGIQFGVEGDGNGGFEVRLRKVRPDDTVVDAGTVNSPTMIPVPFREDAAGVINVEELAAAILAEDPGAGLGATLDSAEFAVQMLRYPAEQRFVDGEVPAPDIADDPRRRSVIDGSFSVALSTKYLEEFVVEWGDRRE
ncbi:MAG: hypothetical protein ACC652_04815 [Acidimicrobiales bacterium]